MKQPSVNHKENTELMYYIVWETKKHTLILEGKVKKELDDMLLYFSEDMEGCEIVNHWVSLHHVHLVLIIPADQSVEHVINAFKQVSNLALESRFPSLMEDAYGKDSYAWSSGYYVATLGFEEANKLESLRKQWLKESQKPGSPAVKPVEAQPK